MVDQDGAEETTSARSLVALLVSVVPAIESSSGHDRDTKHLSEQQRDNETQPGPKEHLSPRLCGRLVDSVVCSI